MESLNIFQKLIEIRKCIDSFKKDTKGFNYSYVSGMQILSKIQNKMNELGILLIPILSKINDPISFEYDTLKFNNTTKKEEEKHNIDWIVSGDMLYRWQNADDKDDYFEIKWFLTGIQNDSSKAFGSALTYSERYFLLKFFNIPTDDVDPDSNQSDKTYKKKSYPEDKNNQAWLNEVTKEAFIKKIQFDNFEDGITAKEAWKKLQEMYRIKKTYKEQIEFELNKALPNKSEGISSFENENSEIPFENK